MANMASSSLKITLAVSEGETLQELERRCHQPGLTPEQRESAQRECDAYRAVYLTAADHQYDLLLEFAAGLVRYGCGGLQPVEDNPPPETREQWIEVLTEQARKRRSEEEVAAQVASWRKPPTQYGEYSSDDLAHDWRVHQWGCYSVGIGHPQTLEWSDEGLTYSCDSKWTPPFKWARAIAERYPQWHIRFAYQSWESGYRGSMEWDGEKWTEEYQDNICMACGRVGCVDPCPAILTPRQVAERNLREGNTFGIPDEEWERKKAGYLAILAKEDE